MDSYALVQVPLFILAGELMNQGGLTLRLIDWSQSLFGHWRGSLGHTSIMTNLVMASVSGSAVADAVATGKPLIPAMQKARYGDGFAGAVIAAGSLLGPIIPPSIPMVVYGQIANQSVIKLFMAGVMPGLLLAAGFMVICTIQAHRRDWLVAESQVGPAVTALIRSITDSPIGAMLVINGFLLLIGCIIEPLPAMIIFVPTLLPLGTQLHIDPIQFGTVIVLNLMIGMMHPPIGLLLFVVSSVGRIPIRSVMVESLPFLAWALIVLVLTILFPQITIWLPSQLR